MGYGSTAVRSQERFYDLFDHVQESWHTYLEDNLSERADTEFHDMLMAVQRYYENDLYGLALHEVTLYRRKIVVRAADDKNREMSGHVFVFSRRLQDVETLLRQQANPAQSITLDASCLIIETDAFRREKNLSR